MQAVDLVDQWDRTLEARLLTPAGVRLSEQPVAPPSVLQLRALTSNAEFVSMDSLDTATRMCPFANAITISGSWLPSEALYKVPPCWTRSTIFNIKSISNVRHVSVCVNPP